MCRFHKKLKIKKTQKKNIFSGFLCGFFRWFFWVFLGGFCIANPAWLTGDSSVMVLGVEGKERRASLWREVVGGGGSRGAGVRGGRGGTLKLPSCSPVLLTTYSSLVG